MSEENNNVSQEFKDNENKTEQIESSIGNENNKQKELETEIETLKDKYIRLLADFENFKKRTTKEKEHLIKYGSENIILEILSIFDDFELALNHIKDNTNDGIVLIYNKFKEFLNRQNIKEIDTSNNIFNENYHECIAVEEVEDEELKGKIIKVLSKGYFYNEKVIRYSKVIVGK